MEDPSLALKSVGQRIRDLRKSKGLSQEELAERAGFHYSYIGGVERAEKNISFINLEKIAFALDASLADLFIYTRSLKHTPSKKELVINRIIEILFTLSLRDLHKVELLINELFKNK